MLGDCSAAMEKLSRFCGQQLGHSLWVNRLVRNRVICHPDDEPFSCLPCSANLGVWIRVSRCYQVLQIAEHGPRSEQSLRLRWPARHRETKPDSPHRRVQVIAPQGSTYRVGPKCHRHVDDGRRRCCCCTLSGLAPFQSRWPVLG